MGERMELLVQHRKSVVEEQKKWEEYLRNLDEKIEIYREKIGEGAVFEKGVIAP